MANEKLTIAQVKEKKLELEAAMLKLAQDFEDETGVKVSYTNFQRENLNRTSSSPEPMEDNYKPGPLINVEVSMDLDLLY